MEKMIEKAKEELELLENQHPHRFDYLKHELKSFISLLQSQLLTVDPLPTTSTATTQASTSMKRKMERRKRACMKRRKMEDGERWAINENNNNNNDDDQKKLLVMRQKEEERDRVDVVLEKAQACLRKIQDFKFSLVR